jgi:hypothetical protein
MKLVTARGAGTTVRLAVLEAAVDAESVTVTMMEKFPMVVGTQVKLATLLEAHGAGRPL